MKYVSFVFYQSILKYLVHTIFKDGVLYLNAATYLLMVFICTYGLYEWSWSMPPPPYRKIVQTSFSMVPWLLAWSCKWCQIGKERQFRALVSNCGVFAFVECKPTTPLLLFVCILHITE